MTPLPDRLQHALRRAFTHAPAVRARFERAGLTPADIQSVADLDRLPVLTKDAVAALQQAHPPFGGLLGVPMSQVRHIFMSPGPLYEPDAGEDPTLMEMTQYALAGSGFAAGDVVLNTLSYHLVPAGLLLDRALVGMGCTAVPGGVGNTDLQARMMIDLGITGYTGTPSFLLTILRKVEEMGLSAALKLRKALVTAEPLPASLRQTLVETYGLTVGNAYATAELGFLALNTTGGLPLRLAPMPVIQVVDAETGQTVGPGEAGEIVVTNFDPAYPLIRFGTGDMALNLDPAPGQSRQEERSIQLVGRSGEAVKVRGMFVHPNQLRAAVASVIAAERVQGVVSRLDLRDHLVVRVALASPPADSAAVCAAIQAAVRQVCRVGADEVLLLPAASLPADARGMVDERRWD